MIIVLLTFKNHKRQYCAVTSDHDLHMRKKTKSIQKNYKEVRKIRKEDLWQAISYRIIQSLEWSLVDKVKYPIKIVLLEFCILFVWNLKFLLYNVKLTLLWGLCFNLTCWTRIVGSVLWGDLTLEDENNQIYVT